MKVILKNENGDFLDENGEAIPREKLDGVWETNKVLVDSNYK